MDSKNQCDVIFSLISLVSRYLLEEQKYLYYLDSKFEEATVQHRGKEGVLYLVHVSGSGLANLTTKDEKGVPGWLLFTS